MNAWYRSRSAISFSAPATCFRRVVSGPSGKADQPCQDRIRNEGVEIERCGIEVGGRCCEIGYDIKRRPAAIPSGMRVTAPGSIGPAVREDDFFLLATDV